MKKLRILRQSKQGPRLEFGSFPYVAVARVTSPSHQRRRSHRIRIPSGAPGLLLLHHAARIGRTRRWSSISSVRRPTYAARTASAAAGKFLAAADALHCMHPSPVLVSFYYYCTASIGQPKRTTPTLACSFDRIWFVGYDLSVNEQYFFLILNQSTIFSIIIYSL